MENKKELKKAEKLKRKEELKKQAAAQKAKNAKRAWARLIKFSRPWYVHIIVAIIAGTISSIFGVIGPYMMADMADYMFMGNHNRVVQIGTIIAILFGIMLIFDYVTGFVMASVAKSVTFVLRKRMSKKINRIPLAYFDKNQTGDILSRVTNDTDAISHTLSSAFVGFIGSVTTVLMVIIFMFVTNWILALVAIGSTIFGFVLMGLIMSKSQVHYDRQQKELGDINSHIEEYYTGHTVMKVSNARGQVNRKFDKLNNNLYKSAWKSQFFGGLLMPIMEFMGQLGFVAIIVVGGILTFNGYITFGVMIAFMIYVRIFTWPLAAIADSMQHFQRTSASAERIFELLDEAELEDESGLVTIMDKPKGAVEFKDVRFGYDPEKPVIKNFNAKIAPASKVAIVGPTGAGKTTLVNLLMKFYKTDSGQIEIDGVPINDLRRDQVAAFFGMVLQDTWLFEGTVRENLLYNMDIPKDKQDAVLEAATEAAGVNHFIKTMPNGFDTVLDEQSNVSAGQRQLLTIARAMIKDAPLLILDEATSSVDTRTEVLIQRAMDKLAQNHTSFVIAHRLSTIKNADLILVMNNGDIVESGRHDDLLKRGGFYAELYNSQFSA